ncbi:dynein regulatory complex subunit 2 isoform X2 [Temnothorax nylanderi]|uniref:dynein regulatory complex subunit 2 isoform X2 n=1 Tax=Temnothorax nylanderi TaxID=102681 RepID=UPI003A86CBD7
MHPVIPASNAKEGETAVRWQELQQRAKTQKQHEAEEHAQMLRKERLMREIELSTLNTMRYRTLWWEMMMRIKIPRIAEDVEIAWRNFDRALDIKDYRISFLMDELAEAEEQYQRNTRSHIEIIDRLLKSYRERLEREERNYRRALNEALVQTDAGINQIYYQQNKVEISLQSITHGVQRQLEESLNNVKSITLSKIDAFVEDSKDIRRISAAQLENQLQGSWENLRRILSDYQNKTKNHRKCYEALKDKDKKDQQIITQQLLRTASLFEEIRKFREQTKDKNQLKILSIEYNKTIKHLKRLVVKGKQLLTLMQICRKYETQDEKVIPFAGHMESENSQTLSSHQIFSLSDWDVSCQITENFQDLMNFWRRFGLAQITIMQLQSKRNKLKAESSHLRECISSYMMQRKMKKV